MLNAIWRKALADIRARPLQVFLLFLVVSAAAATLSLALNVKASAAEPYQRLRRETNGADVWVATFDPQADFEALEGVPGIQAVSGPFPVSWTNFGLRNGRTKQQLALVGMPSQLPAFDHPVVTTGRWLSGAGANEMVLDRGAARRLDLQVGQQVDLLTPSGPVPFTLVGFAVPTGRAPAPMDDPAFAYVLPETLHRLEPDAVFGSSPRYVLRAGIRLAPGTALPDLFARLRPVLGPVSINTSEGISDDIEEANQFDVIFLNVFSIFALVAAGLIIANAVSGQVLSQLRDTGILKAIGFTPRQITLALLLQNMALAVAAAIAGAVLGLVVSPFFLDRSAEALGVPASPALDPVLLALTIAVVTALVGLFTLVPAWRAGRVGAIEALNGGAQGPAGPSRLASLAARLHFPRVAVVGLKDLSRRPLRTFMTVAALVLAVVTATFSLGIEATFRKTEADPTVLGGSPYNIGADRDLTDDALARRIIESIPEVKNYLVVYWIGGRIGNRGFDVRAVEGDLQEPAWPLREGRMPRAAGEVAVSSKLARERDLHVGQRVTIFLGSFDQQRPVEVTVVGRYMDVEGEVMTMKRETVPFAVEPTDYIIQTAGDTRTQRRVAETLVDQSGGNLDPEIVEDVIGDYHSQFRSVLLGLNAVLLSIAGLNLLSGLLLSIRERHRDFAILKAVGFTPAQVGQSVLAGSVALASIAVLVGLPVGLVTTRLMFDVLGNAAGIGTGVGEIPGPLWLLPLVPGAVAVAVLGSVLPAHRAAAVNVADSLRYE